VGSEWLVEVNEELVALEIVTASLHEFARLELCSPWQRKW